MVPVVLGQTGSKRSDLVVAGSCLERLVRRHTVIFPHCYGVSYLHGTPKQTGIYSWLNVPSFGKSSLHGWEREKKENNQLKCLHCYISTAERNVRWKMVAGKDLLSRITIKKTCSEWYIKCFLSSSQTTVRTQILPSTETFCLAENRIPVRCSTQFLLITIEFAGQVYEIQP